MRPSAKVWLWCVTCLSFSKLLLENKCHVLTNSNFLDFKSVRNFLNVTPGNIHDAVTHQQWVRTGGYDCLSCCFKKSMESMYQSLDKITITYAILSENISLTLIKKKKYSYSWQCGQIRWNSFCYPVVRHLQLMCTSKCVTAPFF